MMSLTLGMGIDYTMFLISRFLEEKCSDGYRPKAIQEMIAGSGRVILVSGVSLSVTFFGVVWLPLGILKSVGIGAAVAILSSLGVNLILVPSLLLTTLGRPLVRRAKHARHIQSSSSFDLLLPSKSPSLQTYRPLSATVGPGTLNPYRILFDGHDANITLASPQGFDFMHRVIGTIFAAEKDFDLGPSAVKKNPDREPHI